MKNIRRVVTGYSIEGKSVILEDRNVEGKSISPNKTFIQLWGVDKTPVHPDDTMMEGNLSWFPKPGGHRFFLWVLPPESDHSGSTISKSELETLLPGFLQHFEPDNPGMHTTNTVDCTYVVSGSVILELDNHIETALHQGDTIIQNGTRHRWHNKGLIPAVLITACIGSERKN